FRPRSFGTVLLALGLGLSFPGAAQADGPVTKPDPMPIQIQISPACPQPGGLLHVTILASSTEYRSHMIRSPEYRSSSSAIFSLARCGPALLDGFSAVTLKFRVPLSDVFAELTMSPGMGPVTLQKLTPICGFLTLNTIEMLVQMPAGGAGG